MGERGEGGRANVDAALSRARAATSGTAGGESRDAQTLSVSAAMALAKGARAMQGGLFLANPCEMTDEDCALIFDKSYR